MKPNTLKLTYVTICKGVATLSVLRTGLVLCIYSDSSDFKSWLIWQESRIEKLSVRKAFLTIATLSNGCIFL